MPIGVVIQRPGLEPDLDLEALAQTPLNEGVIALVDRLSLARLVHIIGVNRLTGLVVVSRHEETAWEKGREALRLAEEDPFALRVLDAGDLCGGARDREQATWRAGLLLLAAAAMVREYPWLRPANIRLQLGGLGGRLSRRALLTAPRPRQDIVPAIDEERCAASRGCDLCLKACPVDAIRLDGASAWVDKDRCRNCGLCVSACPTGAADHPFYGRRVLDAGVTALLTNEVQGSHDRIIAFACRGAMAALREAGRRRLAYSAAVLPVEVPSAGFPDIYLILRAFDLGAAGVAVLSCDGACSSACHPQTFREAFSAIERVLDVLGLGSERLALVTADSARRLVSSLDAFAAHVLGLPPHVLCQGFPVPAHAHQYRPAGLLAGIWQRTGIGDALSVQHEGLPFGQVRVDESRCSLCGLCADRCPTGALRYEESSKKANLLFTAADCTGCRLCSDACPENALKIIRSLEESLLRDEPIVLKAADLRRCQQCGRGYAPEAMVSRVLSSLGERAPAVDVGYCPDCRLPAAMGKNCGSPQCGG